MYIVHVSGFVFQATLKRNRSTGSMFYFGSFLRAGTTVGQLQHLIVAYGGLT